MRWFDPQRNETSPRLNYKATLVAAPGGGSFAVAVGTDELRVAAPPEVKLLAIAPDGETVLWSKADAAGDAGARGSALAVSRDGRHAVVGFQNGAVSVWDLAAQRRLVTFYDHTDVVLAVAISPDGRHVASSTRQGHLAVRRLGAAQPVLTWRPAEERLQSVTFLDDHTLVSTGNDLERLRWWWWEPDRLREMLARVTLNPLDPDQQRDLERLLRR
jgi:hypothetical protein